jgi:hypothetical protein
VAPNGDAVFGAPQPAPTLCGSDPATGPVWLTVEAHALRAPLHLGLAGGPARGLPSSAEGLAVALTALLGNSSGLSACAVLAAWLHHLYYFGAWRSGMRWRCA